MIPHETPADLDDIFDRTELTRDEYAKFWGDYWKCKNQAERDELVYDWFGDLDGEPIGVLETGESDFSLFWRNL